MAKLNKTITHEFNVTPEEVARLFIGMTNDQQARFFNECQKIVNKEWETVFDFQMASIIQANELNDLGKKFLTTVGEYVTDSERAKSKAELKNALKAIKAIIEETPELNLSHSRSVLVNDAKTLNASVNEIWEIIDQLKIL